jgi:hypothetical protein
MLGDASFEPNLGKGGDLTRLMSAQEVERHLQASFTTMSRRASDPLSIHTTTLITRLGDPARSEAKVLPPSLSSANIERLDLISSLPDRTVRSLVPE